MSSSGLSSRRTEHPPSGEEKYLLGVIGGSGLCSLPQSGGARVVEVETRYGRPSGAIQLLDHQGIRVAFIPRHGPDHTIAPHRVPYKANLAALKQLGVRHVIATCVVGSLRPEIAPGTFVVPDQFINLTWGRDDTSDVDRRLVHLPMAQPYCGTLRRAIADGLHDLRIQYRPDGCVTVIQGPRFSTVAESKMFTLWGGDIVNMTQYPECYFARELGLCYAAVASVTDYDVGVPSAVSMQPDGLGRVLETFRKNTAQTHVLLDRIIGSVQQFAGCRCAESSIAPYYKQSK